MSESLAGPVLTMRNGAIDDWRRRIALRIFIRAALFCFVIEGILLLTLRAAERPVEFKPGPMVINVLMPALILVAPILILLFAVSIIKRTQARTLAVLTNYKYHWRYHPEELAEFAQLAGGEKWQRTIRHIVRTTYPRVRRHMADEVFIGHTDLYEIGGHVVSLWAPLSQFVPVSGDQLTILKFYDERVHLRYATDGEPVGHYDMPVKRASTQYFEYWILVPKSEADQFKSALNP